MLRESMQQARIDHLDPYLTLAQADAFIEHLLGQHLAARTPQRRAA
jgi:hypothetical protein